jgi:hypothetical protein
MIGVASTNRQTTLRFFVGPGPAGRPSQQGPRFPGRPSGRALCVFQDPPWLGGFDFAHSPPPNPGSWFWGGAEALVHEDYTPPPGPGGSRVRGGGGLWQNPGAVDRRSAEALHWFLR